MKKQETKMTEQQFIAKFKKDGLELYKSEEVSKQALVQAKLEKENIGLKQSFQMVKDNYEREKLNTARLIETNLNLSKK